MVHGIPAKFIVKETSSWPPRTQGGDPVLITDKTMPGTLASRTNRQDDTRTRQQGAHSGNSNQIGHTEATHVPPAASARGEMVLRAAKWLMACSFKCIKRITLVVAAPPPTPYKDRRQKCKTVFHFLPSSRQNDDVFQDVASYQCIVGWIAF
ncbi:hypothetical protein EVAR_30890_1 [Eumeta japonica]|uniref:Uncharacterized protein n=1 Tax=Eumeta variegata TaxID=151549 RepID=A0A4C1V4U0_EUMVA|nr:hypothetical protein EVAR_30890_1 [Eumeta japonica]